jgi:uncharacterized DUF497 family protein
MPLGATGFDWDEGNREKCQRHGVQLTDIEAMFGRPLSVLPDPAHSRNEERFKAIGRNEDGRHILIVFTLRERDGEVLIRPISARFMHQREVRYYEEEAAKTDDRRRS